MWFSNINLLGNPGVVLSNNGNICFPILFNGDVTFCEGQCEALLYIICYSHSAPLRQVLYYLLLWRKLISYISPPLFFLEGLPDFPCCHTCRILLKMLVCWPHQLCWNHVCVTSCYPLCLTRNLAYRRCYLSICWLTGWMNGSVQRGETADTKWVGRM